MPCTPSRWPVFVKPARAGSSMGITKVSDPEALEAAIEAAREHDPKVVVEAAVFGREIECGVLEGHGTDADPHERARRVHRGAEPRVLRLRGEVPRRGRRAARDARRRAAGGRRRDPRDGGPGVRRGRLRGAGAGRLLPHRDRRRPRQRGQHDAGLHAALDVPADVGGERGDLPRAHRRADRAGRWSAVAPACADGTGGGSAGVSGRPGRSPAGPWPPARTPAAAAARGRRPRHQHLDRGVGAERREPRAVAESCGIQPTPSTSRHSVSVGRAPRHRSGR